MIEVTIIVLAHSHRDPVGAGRPPAFPSADRDDRRNEAAGDAEDGSVGRREERSATAGEGGCCSKIDSRGGKSAAESLGNIFTGGGGLFAKLVGLLTPQQIRAAQLARATSAVKTRARRRLCPPRDRGGGNLRVLE